MDWTASLQYTDVWYTVGVCLDAPSLASFVTLCKTVNAFGLSETLKAKTFNTNIELECAQRGYISLLKEIHFHRRFPTNTKHSPPVVSPPLLEWANLESYILWIKRQGVNPSQRVWALTLIASAFGHLNVLYYLNRCYRLQWCQDASYIAAWAGQFHILKWRQTVTGETNYFMDGMYAGAARGGQVKILEWLMKEYIIPRNAVEICSHAARSGNLEMVKWLRQKRFMMRSATNMMAALGGHLDIIKFATQNGVRLDHETLDMAAQGGHLELVKWLVSNGCTLSDRVSKGAAAGGSLEVLEWTIDRGCQLTPEICYHAARTGRLDILMWAVERGCKIRSGVANMAAKFGHLDILKWIREKGYCWTSSVLIDSAEGHHYEIFRWAVKNGCKFGVEDCKYIVLDEETREWFIEQPEFKCLEVSPEDLFHTKYLSFY